MSDLFGGRPTPAQPTKAAKGGPIEHRCQTCRQLGATCGIGETWFHYRCTPDDWFPGGKRP